jgi:hypothetical protein
MSAIPSRAATKIACVTIAPIESCIMITCGGGSGCSGCGIAVSIVSP